jgi:acyl transferase domain-containing protein/acyl carrier protein
MTEELLASLRQSLQVIDQLEGELSRLREDIAVVGMSCRFPGAGGVTEYWDMLCQGVDAITPVPADRWDNAAIYDPDPERAGTVYTEYGGFVADVDKFDPLFFGISPKEAARIDPQHRMLLEVAWEALEDAGLAPRSLRGSRTGVYVGIAENDYARLIERAHGDRLDTYDATGTGFCFASGRLSHVLGLHGPNVAVDTGCSSSLVSIHQAVTALRLGECDLALAGGVHLRLTPTTTLSLARARALAPDGRCKTFSAAADGFARSEGCGIVVFKRLSDALEQGDTVLAVVKGSSVNHDGPASGFTVPNENAQVDLIRAALRNAGVEPDEVDLIEAHGTGTALGDPIEVSALTTVFGGRTHDLVLGAVKSAIGHTEGAAGVAGFIKAVLALRHGVIPPNLHFTEPSPHIDWARLPFVVPTRTRPWPRDGRAAGVSSFGMSGTNAHVVLGAAPAEPPVESSEAGQHVLTVSARSEAALDRAITRMTGLLESGAAPADVCFTAATARDHFEHRAAVVGDSAEALVARLRNRELITGHVPAHRRAPKVAFLFTGQGAQYAGMGRELYETQPVFREAVDRCGGLRSGDLDQTGNTQPALFTVEYALAELWRSWGVHPDVVLGHSVGGLVAACVSGALSLEDALALVTERARLMQELPPGGAMVSVRAPEEVVASAIAGHAWVSIAAVNGPGETVVSGDAVQVAEVVDVLTEQGVRTKPLKVSHAFHSPLMGPIRERFAAVAPRMRTPEVPWVSDLTGRLVDNSMDWVAHALSPVRFADAMGAAWDLGARAFVEVGPKPVLLGLGRGCVPDPDEALWLPSMRPGRDQLAESLAHLHVNGVPVDWAGVHAPATPRRVPLPTYPFERERHWFTTPIQVAPLLGTRTRLPKHRSTVFQTELGQTTTAFLGDHRIHGALVSPAAAHLAMVVSAAQAELGDGEVELTDVVFPAPLVVPDEGTRTVQVELTAGRDGGTEFQVTTHPDDETASVHATGHVSTAGSASRTVDIDDVRGRCGRSVDPAELYASLADQRIGLGPAFRWLNRIWVGDDEVLATVARPSGVEPVSPVHPGLLDALFQATALNEPEARVPFGVRRLSLRTTSTAHWVHARRAGEHEWDIDLLDEAGEVVLAVEGFADRPVPAGGFAAPEWADWLLQVEWRVVDSGGGDVDIDDCVVLGGDRTRFRLVGAGPADLFVQRARNILFIPDADLGTNTPAHTEELLTSLLTLIQVLQAGTGRPPRLFIVTRLAHAIRPGELVDPTHTAVWGLARTIAAEHPELRCTILDLDDLANLNGHLDTTYRYSAVRDGIRYVPELAPASLLTEDTCLRLADYGSTEHVRAVPMRRRQPASHEIEIEVRAAGLNLRDVLVSLGMMREHYPENLAADDLPLGFECAGVVAAVGSEVDDVAVGDPVMAMTEGGFADYVTVDARYVAPVPDGLTFTQAATIPLAFLTAHYALTRLAKLRKGERVLIHAASGGVGHAAVQIAQAIGAEVVATASAGKQEHVRALGIQHVFDSRSTSFAGATTVDVVLNSLTGEFIPAGLSTVAKDGRFVEMGKLGIWSAERMRAERPDVGYFPFDLGDDAEEQPGLIPELFAELVELFRAGTLNPLPMTVFADPVRAYAHMRRAAHVGKVVVTFGRPTVRADGCYLITGGLGGIGLQVAQGLVDAGARTLVLVSRRGEAPEITGANVRVVTADVSQEDGVRQALAACEGPLRGIVHAAGVVDDGVLAGQSAERFGRVLGGKVGGAYWLHELTRREPLDFFLACSSLASLTEDGGQGAYPAANAFLDGLLARRRALGLPGVSVNWGPWAEVGMAAGLAEQFAKAGERMIPPVDGVAATLALLGAPMTQVAVVPGTTVAAPQESTVDTPDVPTDLDGYVRQVIRMLLGLPSGYRLDEHAAFAELGMDSLMVIELRNHLQRDLDVTLAATVAFDYPTVGQLRDHLASRLGLDTQPEQPAAPSTSLDDLRDLMDQELDLLDGKEVA